MKRLVLLTALWMLLVSIPLSIHAQEKEITLETVVVTATRDVQEIRRVPANVTVITREGIEQSNSQTVIDLVRNEVGVVVRDFYGTGKTASVDIRGFGETGPLNTLVLVDGRRVNEIDLSGVDWTQIPLDQVERIEIVRGPGTVLYGDNAVGGVINIITKKPEKPFSASAEGVVGSYHTHRESGSVSGKWGPFSAIVNAGYHATGGYRDNGFLRTKDAGGKLTYEVNDHLSFNLQGSFHQDDSGLPGGLPKAIYKSHRQATLNPTNRAETEDGYLTFGAKAKLGGWGRLETDLSYRQRGVDTLLDFPAYAYTYQDERSLRTWGVTPKYILEKPLWRFPNKLTLGFDFYRSTSEVSTKETFGGFFSTNRSEVKKRSAGLYLLDEVSLLTNLILSLGYRHEWVNYDLFQETPRLKEDVKENEPAWNVGLDFLFDKRSSAFISVKRSFRFPVSDEWIVLDLNTFELKVHPAMNPQTGTHYEVGVRHVFSDQIEANLTLFWVDLRDEIFFNPETFTNENYSKTRRQGVEIGAKVRPFPCLLVWGNYSYTRPTLRGDAFSGNDIPGVPRHKGTLGVDLDLGRGFFLNTKANIVGARHFISDWQNRLGRLGGHITVDTKLSYSWKGLKVFAGINNLFNETYAEWAVTNATGTMQLFYPSPERNFFGGISYVF